MNYINSIVSLQRKINNILCKFRGWAYTYVNNIICNAKSLDNFLFKLHILFKIFIAYKILIKPTKLFFNYPNVGLLGEYIDFLGFTTAVEKLQAIKLLIYLKIFKALKYYLSFTGYLRFYIHVYA